MNNQEPTGVGASGVQEDPFRSKKEINRTFYGRPADLTPLK